MDTYISKLGCVLLVLTLFGGRFSLLRAQEESGDLLRQNLEKFEQYRTSDPEKALHYARLVGVAADTMQMVPEAAPLFDFLANHCENVEFRYDDALRYKLQAAALYEELDSRRDIARTAADLGRLHLKDGNYHRAHTTATKGYHTARSLRDTLSMREAALTLEQVEYFYHQSVDRAMKFNREVADTFQGRAQADQTVRALNNRFHYPLSPDQVQEILSRSEPLCRRYGFNDMLLNIYLNVALQEINFGDLEASAHYLDLAKALISNFKEEGYYYSALGFYHLNTGDIQAAIEETKRSIELLDQGDFDAKNVHAFFLLQKLYQMEGRYEEAYNALMEFAEIYTRQINTTDFIDLSKSISELELKRMREWHLFVIVILVLGVVLLIVGITLFYSRQKLAEKNRRLLAEKAEQELRAKNEIIKIQKLQQYQEQRNMATLTEELSEAVKGSDGKQMRSEISRIITRLEKSPDVSQDWAEVEKMLSNNNDPFFDNLIRAYPNLTKNERKLCTFIHLNLSTKEISKITHQTPGSIHIARSRLRQKFGLTNSDQSLITFLDRFK